MSCRRVTSRGAGFTWSYHFSYFRLSKHLEIYVLIEKKWQQSHLFARIHTHFAYLHFFHLVRSYDLKRLKRPWGRKYSSKMNRYWDFQPFHCSWRQLTNIIWRKKRHDWNWMDNFRYLTMKWWLPKKGKRRTERTCWSRSVPFGWKRNRLTDENWTFYRLWTRECAMEGLFLLFYCKGGQISQKLVYI